MQTENNEFNGRKTDLYRTAETAGAHRQSPWPSRPHSHYAIPGAAGTMLLWRHPRGVAHRQSHSVAAPRRAEKRGSHSRHHRDPQGALLHQPRRLAAGADALCRLLRPAPEKAGLRLLRRMKRQLTGN